ncbi:ABC transporter substrate-binding protein [Gorillibacterium massiliense]|uniref:ABC transporter substrate-binding protein n=1 Tax=Gorillibacterium massiliense TaxID=1280390 RepID=UPI0004B34E43|nr:ABC transporter substrate-binding protein [Gorillibacterium massiliense]
MNGKWWSGAALICLTILLTGCNGDNRAKESPNSGIVKGEESQALTGKITVLTNRIDLVENGVMAKYAREFTAKYPGAKVEFEGLSNYASDIMIRLSTMSFGDVLLIPNNIANKDLGNYYEPLDSSMFENLRFSDFKAYEGKRYGVATGASTEGIVYSKKAFAAAGITEIPTTLDAFYDACRKLKEHHIVPVYMNYGAQWPMKEWGETLVSYMSGDPEKLNEMADQDEPWQMDNDWGKGLTIAKTLINRGYVEPDLLANKWENSKVELAQGRAAMYFLGNWVVNQIVDAGANSNDIGFFPFPYDNNMEKRNAPITPDWFIGVSKFSSNKPLAKAWINFFVRESGFVDTSGFMPVDTTKESSLPQLQEFLSFHPVLVESTPPNDRFLDIATKAQIGLWTGDYIQDLLAGSSLEEGFQLLNQKWKEARQSELR